MRDLLLLVLLAGGALGAEPQDREPPLSFYFDGEGGKRVAVELDKPFSTAGLGKSATLRLEPTRQFASAGLAFKYPREYVFEAELQPGLSMWTLSGNDCKFIIQRYLGQKKTDALHQSAVAGIRKAFGGAEKTREKPVKLELRGTTLEGTRIELELGSTRIVQDLFPLSSGGDLVEFIIQDAPKAPGEPTPDRTRAEALLRETLKLPAK